MLRHCQMSPRAQADPGWEWWLILTGVRWLLVLSSLPCLQLSISLRFFPQISCWPVLLQLDHHLPGKASLTAACLARLLCFFDRRWAEGRSVDNSSPREVPKGEQSGCVLCELRAREVLWGWPSVGVRLEQWRRSTEDG